MPSQRGFVGVMFQGEKGEERRDVVGRGIWEWRHIRVKFKRTDDVKRMREEIGGL